MEDLSAECKKNNKYGYILKSAVAWSAQRILMTVNLGFLDRSHYFSLKHLLSDSHKTEWTPFQRHFSESMIAPEIKSGISGSVASNSGQ
jgi:hypothetical protein